MNLNFRDIASKLTPRGWLAVGAAALVGFVVLILTFNLASAPSYSTLVAGISPTQTGKITSALSTAGIQYQLQNNGTAIAVQASQEAQARVVLGGQGLLSGAGSSASLTSLLGPGGLGQSSQQQQEQLISALEQQLTQQIEAMNGINSAQVMLAIPDPANTLFSSTASHPSGSVLLNTSGSLSSGQVKAIAEQVANAVPQLNVNKVTVTDQSGDLLWPTGSGSSNATANTRQAAQQNYDQAMANKAQAMLAATVGPGAAVVQVTANLNANQQTTDSVTYAKTGTPLTTNTSNEKLKSTGAAPAAAGNTATQLGAVGNYAGTTGGNSNYSNKTNQTNFGVNKTVSHLVVAPGAVNSQSISVLVNSTVPKSEIPAIQSAVENAVGYVKKRDTISVGTLAFAKTPATPAAPSSTKTMIGYVKYVAMGLGALLFLFFITRMLRRRESEEFAGNPTWLRELEGARPLAALEAERHMVDLEQPAAVARLRSPVNLARQQIEDLVDRDPERVASQVRQWMSED